MAQQRLCGTYKSAARVERLGTNGGDRALPRTARSNCAVFLHDTSNYPSLDQKHRGAAQGLATTYQTDKTTNSEGAATDAEFGEALAPLQGRDAAMKKVCGVG